MMDIKKETIEPEMPQEKPCKCGNIVQLVFCTGPDITDYYVWKCCVCHYTEPYTCEVKQWVSLEDEINSLNQILEDIANADNIMDGNCYMELKKSLNKHIQAIKKEGNE